MTDQGSLVLVFDDGYVEDDEAIRPVLESRGVPACLAIVPAWLGGPEYLTSVQVGELDDLGWEVAAHGRRHRYLQAHRLARDAEPGDSRLPLDSDHVFPAGDHGLYPGDEFEITDGVTRDVRELADTGEDGDPYIELESPLDAAFVAGETVVRPTRSVLEAEIAEVREDFRDIGLDPSTFVLPYDAADARAWELVEAHYDALANAAVRSLPNPPGTPLTNLRRYYLETDAMTSAEIETYLDDVAARGGLGVLAGHTAWETVTADRVGAVVDGALDRGIDVTTFRALRE